MGTLKLIMYIGIVAIILMLTRCKPQAMADLALINGNIITADSNFSIAEAVAITHNTILSAGTTREIKKLTGRKTEVIDLNGKTVIPGIIDSHLHPETAALSELYEIIPDVHTIEQLLTWIRNQATVKEKGSWIVFPKFFPTRLEEMRQPTLCELDEAAPFHPVFLNGSFGGMINSLAMSASGITKTTNNSGIVRDNKTGLPTGFLRASAFELLKIPQPGLLTYPDRKEALIKMLTRYNQFGITSICSGAGDPESMKIFRNLADSNLLTTRVYQNILFPAIGKITRASVAQQLKRYKHMTGYGDEWVRIGSLKVFLDGGILTGTAYMNEPWGAKAAKIFGIEDPSYNGVINFTHEELLTIVSGANESGWSFTAHATGDGSVKLLLDVYKEVSDSKSINGKRFSVIHGNFFCKDEISLMKELGVYAMIQPAWFYKDADAMQYILGKERIRSFHPNLTMIKSDIMLSGGSDHMVKWDANSSINPYNPFLALWSMITRKTESGSVISPDESISRKEALKIYTINNAYASFEESLKGSIEPGKLADMVVLTDNYLECPEDDIKDIEALITIVGGKIVYSKTNVP